MLIFLLITVGALGFFTGVLFNDCILYLANKSLASAHNVLSRSEHILERAREIRAEADVARLEADRLNVSTADMLSKMAADSEAIKSEITKAVESIGEIHE